MRKKQMTVGRSLEAFSFCCVFLLVQIYYSIIIVIFSAPVKMFCLITDFI